jgi:diguanylate cyclase (GGDEF)-like protein
MTVAHVCVKIRKLIESTQVDFEGKQHNVTVSLGAALLPVVGKPYTPESLIESADKQLYAAKDKGRNCCSMKQLKAGQPVAQTASA